jgi:hypothetical protein
MAVLNDFEANGYGILALGEEDMVVLNDVPIERAVRPSARPLRPTEGRGRGSLLPFCISINPLRSPVCHSLSPFRSLALSVCVVALLRIDLHIPGRSWKTVLRWNALLLFWKINKETLERIGKPPPFPECGGTVG